MTITKLLYLAEQQLKLELEEQFKRNIREFETYGNLKNGENDTLLNLIDDYYSISSIKRVVNMMDPIDRIEMLSNLLKNSEE